LGTVAWRCCAGEHDHRARAAQQHLPVEIELLFQVRVRARVAVDELGGVLAALGVPFVSVEIGRIVLYDPIEVVRVNHERAAFGDVRDRHPPVHLTGRAGIPGVAVVLVGVAHAAREVPSRGHHAELGHVEVGLRRVTAHLLQHLAEQDLRLGVVREAGLERRQDLHEPLHRQLELGPLGIVRMEGLANQSRGEIAQRADALSSVVGEGVANEEGAPPLLVRYARFNENCRHIGHGTRKRERATSTTRLRTAN
jgi:hypothetical protein